MIYIIDESWRDPDEIVHSYYDKAFHSKEDALLKAEEMIQDKERLFNLINKEYHTVVLNDGYTIETIDSKFEYTVSVILIEGELAGRKNSGLDMCIDNINKVYYFLSFKYNKIISEFGKVPDFVEVSIRWKDDNKSERVLIAFNEKHDEFVTFLVNNLLEFALLFFEESKEDFVCENVVDIHFGIWDG